jgi:transcriptional regulator with XRE-family HTH domain
METGEKLRKARKQALLTQGELADESGVASSTINRTECGKGVPHPHTLRRLAAALGIPARDLIADDPLSHDAATYVTRSLSPDS